MKKIYVIIFLICSIICQPLFAQAYNGSLTLSTQASIDNFNYTSVTGDLFIRESTPGEITNLNGLSELVSVGNELNISINTSLNNLEGLSSLAYVGGYLVISLNSSLKNLEGLEKLTAVGQYLIIYRNDSLLNLDGLAGLTSIRGDYSREGFYSYIQSNKSLQNIDALSSLDSVFILTFEDNDALTSLNALSGLNSIYSLIIKGNDKLTTLGDMWNIKEIPYLEISENNSLVDISALSGVTGLGTVRVVDNPALTDYCGLYAYFNVPQGIYRDYTITGNGAPLNINEIINSGPCFPQVFSGDIVLTSQEEVNYFNYTKVTGSLTVTGIDITNLYGLLELDSVGGNFTIQNNPKLTVDYGLNNLSFVGGNFIFSGNSKVKKIISPGKLINLGGSLTITNNLMLEQYCGLYPLFSGGYSGSTTITGNKTNPSSSDIAGGGACDTRIFWGDVTISNQAQVDSFKYTDITGKLIIKEAAPGSINNLDGLLKINFTWDLSVSDNSSLSSLSGLDSLSLMGNCLISNNNSLVNVDALLKFREADAITIINNKSLVNINGFKNMYSVLFIDIAQNDLLVDIDGLSGVKNTQYVYILNNASLVDLNGLASIDSVQSLELWYNPVLSDITGLSNLRWAGRLEISGNGISNLHGLENLAYIRYLTISNNPALKTLSGLDNLEFTDDMRIWENFQLSQFCALYNLFKNGSTRDVSIYSNKANPTPSQIIAYGPCNEQFSFIADLRGDNVVPPVITEATGGASFLLNGTNDTLFIRVRLCGIQSPPASVCFHLASKDSTGPAVKDITAYFRYDTAGYKAYAIWTAKDKNPLTQQMVDELRAGNIYLAVYTSAHPGGELRGQVTYNEPVTLYSHLSGAQVVPPVNSNSTGEGYFVLAGDGKTLTYLLKFNKSYNYVQPSSGFYQGPSGSNGILKSKINFTGDSISGTWDIFTCGPLTPQLTADLLACNVYVQFATAAFPGGELRGQIYKLDGDTSSNGHQTITSAEGNNGLPTEYALAQNYPNPFNPSTNINYDLPAEGFVTLVVYDAVGRQVASLVNEQKPAGRYTVTFTGSNLSSGVYFYRLHVNDYNVTRKLMLLK